MLKRKNHSRCLVVLCVCFGSSNSWKESELRLRMRSEINIGRLPPCFEAFKHCRVVCLANVPRHPKLS